MLYKMTNNLNSFTIKLAVHAGNLLVCKLYAVYTAKNSIASIRAAQITNWYYPVLTLFIWVMVHSM